MNVLMMPQVNNYIDETMDVYRDEQTTALQ